MKKIYFYLSITAMLIFAWLFVTKPLAYEQMYISFYCLTISFVIYFMFSKLTKSINVTNVKHIEEGVYVNYKNTFKEMKKLYPYWIFIITLFIGTLILVTKNKHEIPQNTVTLLFNTLIVYLTFLYSLLLNKPRIVALNNLPAFFNMIILVPLIFKNKLDLLESIFNYSIFNSLINSQNRPYTILYPLILISLFLVLLKYLSKHREIKSS